MAYAGVTARAISSPLIATGRARESQDETTGDTRPEARFIIEHGYNSQYAAVKGKMTFFFEARVDSLILPGRSRCVYHERDST
jgi:hypothetical protein